MGLDVSSALRTLRTGRYRIIRRSPGGVDGSGHELPAITTVLEDVPGVVHPAANVADDEQRNKSGSWSTDRIIGRFELADLGGIALAGTDVTALADRIEYQGKIYEAVNTLDFGEAGGYSECQFAAIGRTLEEESP